MFAHHITSTAIARWMITNIRYLITPTRIGHYYITIHTRTMHIRMVRLHYTHTDFFANDPKADRQSSSGYAEVCVVSLMRTLKSIYT